MTTKKVKKRGANLTKRAKYLLEKSKVMSRDARASLVLRRLQDIGRVALIGGAIRDLAFKTNHSFASDLDFVVEVEDSHAYTDLIDSYHARANKFGGYRISLEGIDIDFWEAKSSWANTRGHRVVESLEDVLETTFFNVDALLYIVSDDKIQVKEGTFEALDKRYLDINLRPNPNPLGAAVRALRRMCQFDMQASRHLAEFIAEQIDSNGWEKIAALERMAYQRSTTLQKVAKSPSNGLEFLANLEENNFKLPLICQLELSL